VDGIAESTDEASLYANVWNLTSINLSLEMPGDFIGEDENGAEKSLIPYGMFVIASEDNSGNSLAIAANKTIRVSIPVADNNPPATVALWQFDEVEGVWKQKGTAFLEGQFYVAQISEFGKWAIADMAEKIDISGTVFKESEPAENILVALSNVNTGTTRFIHTNSKGTYSFKVPANSSVKVGPYSRSCEDFTEDRILSVAEEHIENQDFSAGNGITVYSGESRDCNKEPLTNGYVIIADQVVVKLDETGRFNGTFSEACLSPLSFRTFDISNQEMAPTASPGNISPVQVHLVACEGLSEFTNLNYNTLVFGFKGDSEGTYSVSSLELNDQLNNKNFEITEIDVDITLNETAEMGETLTGSFAGEFLDVEGAAHSLSGNFRVIKDN